MSRLSNMFGSRIMLFIALAGAASLPSSADTIVGTLNNLNGSGLNATATLVVNTSTQTFTLDFNLTNTLATPANIHSFALQLFSSSMTAGNSSPLPPGWEFFANEKINNNGTTGCTGISHPGWLCADDNLNSTAVPAVIPAMGANGHIDFNFSGTYTGTPVNPLDLMANGDFGPGLANKWAVSQGITTTGGSPVPEPSSFLFLSTGLPGVMLYWRRRRK